MKNPRHLTLSCVLGLSLIGVSAYADDSGSPAHAEKPPVKVPVQVPDLKPGDRVTQEKPNHPEHPETPGRPALPDDLKKLISDFQQAKDAFLAEQKKLRKDLGGATKDARDAIREQIKDSREKFLADQKALRDQIRQRLDELKQGLKDHADVIDKAKEDAKDRAKDKAKQRKGGG